MDRDDALMADGHKRLRPTLISTFALVSGMLPMAVGIGEGGEFYRPMVLSIIGGTISSTFLTLLGIPSFYGGIEVSRDHAVARSRARQLRWKPFLALIVTMLEALARLLLLRVLWLALARMVHWLRRCAACGLGAQPARSGMPVVSTPYAATSRGPA